MTREEILVRMDLCAKQDRERFFRVADGMNFQPKYDDRRTQLEEIKQQWRDMTLIEHYPEIQWPLELPQWFPPVRFASCWEADYAVDIALVQG